MALEAEWDGHEVFFISNKDSRCLRPTREVLEHWYAPFSPVLVDRNGRAAQISSFPAAGVLRQVPRHADRRKPGHV